jgi:signal transduction histidine kinase
MRAGVVVGAVAVVLLALLNLSLLVQTRAAGTVATPSMHRLLAETDRTSWALVLVGSVVFLGGVILVGVLESHRTAGAAYAIRRAVDALRDGRSDVRVRLRRGDHLQDLANSINRLAEAIDSERARHG